MPAGAEALRYEAPLVQVNNSVSDDLLIRSMFNCPVRDRDVRKAEQILQGDHFKTLHRALGHARLRLTA